MSFQNKQKLIPLVFFGRLEERKGLCTFIKAISLLEETLRKKIQIKFLGKVVPLYSKELQHLNSEQYIENSLGTEVFYEIISNLYSSQAIDYVSALNNPIVCLTSPQENFPNSALEMGQLPVPLVVSDTGGFRETLQLINRTSGLYWFKPKDPHSLSEMITKALSGYPEIFSVADRTTLEKTNETLLEQKLEYIEQAFNQASLVTEKSLPKITIGLTFHNQTKDLMDCLYRIESQSYENKEVIVIDNGSDIQYSQEIFEQAKALFSDYKFIGLDNYKGLGAVRNHLVDISSGEYCLFLEPHILLMPFALEKFAQAACNSEADIITCSRKEIGLNIEDKIISFTGGTIPLLLKFNTYERGCTLFARSLLQMFRHTESLDISNPAWEIIAAATATGKKIISFPYPLYECRVDNSSSTLEEPHPREQYSVRQYLAKILPSDWSPRQIYMLLTAVQQLQNKPQPSLPPDETIELRAQITSLQAQLEQAQKEAEDAKERINAMETSKFWELRKTWFRVKRKFGLPTNE